MNETKLMEDKSFREQMVSRVEVLGKVKELFLLPQLDMMTIQQVSEYYEVENEVVRKCYQRDREEIDQDGVQKYSPRTVSERLGQDVPSVKTKTYCEFHLSPTVTLRVPNAGILLFPKRAILRIGMLLRDSEVAREVRTQLLNTFEHADDQARTEDINDEQTLLMNIAKSFATGDPTQVMIATQAYAAFQRRHIEKLQAENTEIRKEAETVRAENEVVNKSNELLAAKVLSWADRDKLNKAVRTLSGLSGCRTSYCYKELYDELLYKWHISLGHRQAADGRDGCKRPKNHYIRADEWPAVQQSLAAICMNHNISPANVFQKAKLLVDEVDE